jgi:phosphoribosylformylglycinamidine synthase PurS subunit
MSTPTWRARVDVRLEPNVNDPQGNAVLAGLRSLGHDDVAGVRVGKIVELTLAAPDAATARERVDRMCHELLANPIIESFDIAIAEAGEDA